MAAPGKNQSFPLTNYNRRCLTITIKNPNIIVGDYTYNDDFYDRKIFEKYIGYHFDFIGDKLIIGKFCRKAASVTFIM